jgi:hypothetical protein
MGLFLLKAIFAYFNLKSFLKQQISAGEQRSIRPSRFS